MYISDEDDNDSNFERECDIAEEVEENLMQFDSYDESEAANTTGTNICMSTIQIHGERIKRVRICHLRTRELPNARTTVVGSGRLYFIPHLILRDVRRLGQTTKVSKQYHKRV